MSFFKKTLASFGIGSAQVDTVLQQEVLYPGQKVNVTVYVYGGATEQAIDNIDLKLCCRYIKEVPVSHDKAQHQTTNKRRAPQSYILAKWNLPMPSPFIQAKRVILRWNWMCRGTHQLPLAILKFG